MATKKSRLDQLLVDRGLAPSRTKALALILAGRVRGVGGRLDKPGVQVRTDAEIHVEPGPQYVGRGAFKLLGALDAFGLDPSGHPAIDVGSSTGGFTEVLLERGAPRVIAVDAGRGQLDWSLRNQPEVHVMEGCNARYLTPEQLPYRPRFASMDVSFISILKILPALIACMDDGGEIVSLIKPQFEAGRGSVGRGGIVRDPTVHREVLEHIVGHALSRSWGPQDLCASPIDGADGNREFFVHLRPGRATPAADFLAARVAALTESP